MKNFTKILSFFVLFVILGFTIDQDITPKRTDVAGFTDWTDTDITGTTYIQLLKATSVTISPVLNFDAYTSETLNFKARTYGGLNAVENEVTVWISVDNGSNWTSIGTALPTTTTLTAQTPIDISSYSGTQVQIKFTVAGTNNTNGAGIDDIAITGIASVGATLDVVPASLTAFTYEELSGPSAEQTFTVAGSLLDGSDVTITPSTNYEISLTTGAGFVSTPIVLTAFDGTSTTIYVRLVANLAVGTYNSEVISIEGGGALLGKTVTCSGSVTEIPQPTLTLSTSTLTGFNYVESEGGPSSEKSFKVSGTTLDGTDVIITTPVDFEISLTSGAGFSSSITLPSFDGTETTIFVRLKAGLSIAVYADEIISIEGGNASAVYVTCSGQVSDVSLSCASDLIISEYIEGSSNNKAIEIFNGTGADVDLSGYSIKKQSNGVGAFTSELVLSGTLADAESFLIVYSSAGATLLAMADLVSSSSSLTFNGNDAVALFKGVDSVDVVGIYNDITSWGTDMTLVRKDTVTAPSVAFAMTDWVESAIDDFSNSGVHTMTCGSGTSVEEIENNNSASIYPNPSNGNFNIKIENEKATNVKIEVIDLTGKIVSTKEISNVTNTIENVNVSKLSKGMYFVKVNSNVQKITIE